MEHSRLYDYRRALIAFTLMAVIGIALVILSLPAQAEAAMADDASGALRVNSGTALVTTQTAQRKMTLENARGTVHVYPMFYVKGELFIGSFDISSSNRKTKEEPIKLKSSNKKICELESTSGHVWCYIHKPGKVNVSYTWKGKKHTVKLVVHKWTLPMTAFKVNGKNYMNKFKASWSVPSGSKYVTGKVKVKAVKGWKLKRLEASDVNYREKTIKNNKTVLRKSDKIMWVAAVFEHKASGQSVVVGIAGKGFAIPM